MVHQINQSLQSIKYHRTKWPWFPYKVIPLRLMGRWGYYSPWVQLVFIYFVLTYLFLCACTFKEGRKPTYFQNHILSLSNMLPFICYAGNILGKPLNMMTNTLELIWCSTLMTYLICQAPLSLKHSSSRPWIFMFDSGFNLSQCLRSGNTSRHVTRSKIALFHLIISGINCLKQFLIF